MAINLSHVKNIVGYAFVCSGSILLYKSIMEDIDLLPVGFVCMLLGIAMVVHTLLKIEEQRDKANDNVDFIDSIFDPNPIKCEYTTELYDIDKTNTDIKLSNMFNHDGYTDKEILIILNRMLVNNETKLISIGNSDSSDMIRNMFLVKINYKDTMDKLLDILTSDTFRRSKAIRCCIGTNYVDITGIMNNLLIYGYNENYRIVLAYDHICECHKFKLIKIN